MHDYDGISGQDRESYTDDQDRESYVVTGRVASDFEEEVAGMVSVDFTDGDVEVMTREEFERLAMTAELSARVFDSATMKKEPRTVTLAIENVMDQDHLDRLIDLINSVAYVSGVHVESEEGSTTTGS